MTQNMNFTNTCTSEEAQKRARLDVEKFRFLCRLSRLAPYHQAHALFNGAGGALQAGVRRKP